MLYDVLCENLFSLQWFLVAITTTSSNKKTADLFTKENVKLHHKVQLVSFLANNICKLAICYWFNLLNNIHKKIINGI